MRKAGIDVVSFGAGEPDFDTPLPIKEAAIEAIRSGFTKYTPSSGIGELKEAVVEKLRRENGLDYPPSQVIISCGAKHSIYNILMAICDPGDEVIIGAPYWVSYPEMVRLAGGNPVIVRTSPQTGYCMTPDEVRSKVTSKTKAIILNSPANPTGTVYPEEFLRGIGELAVEADFYIISDEIYEKLIYDGLKHVSVAALSETFKERTILVNGVSKSYAMTGWRIGYAAGPEEVIGAMSRIQSHSTSNPTSISQMAALAALKGDQGEVERMRREFERRRDLICSKLDEIDGISYVRPQGAFYVFPNVSAYFGKRLRGKIINGSLDFAEAMLESANVALVPGVAFGDDECVRLSFATSEEMIEEGLNRIKRALDEVEG
ncbi:TPA: pyridoxal phosphate-dependent aminotransferase [Candidatus Poribacteria bacterium]|nr:pyridoxal phosphate-dependent aminotransferase [Candidatus Poribacteria bacterium]